jgi:hypothetical protein
LVAALPRGGFYFCQEQWPKVRVRGGHRLRELGVDAQTLGNWKHRRSRPRSVADHYGTAVRASHVVVDEALARRVPPAAASELGARRRVRAGPAGSGSRRRLGMAVQLLPFEGTARVVELALGL